MSVKTMHEGADIIIRRWVKTKPGETVIIITDPSHENEAECLKASAEKVGARGLVHIVPLDLVQDGLYFDTIDEFLDQADVIIGATNYSIVTTHAVQKELADGARFLSLPLATSDGRSLLEYDFVRMEPDKAEIMAEFLLSSLRKADEIRVTTDQGTDLLFYKKDRHLSFFNGEVDGDRKFASASFEIYIAIEETKTQGIGFIDGSLGYVGKVENPVRIEVENGKLIHIENSPDGKRLADYMDSFHDDNLYFTSELGIGLNPLSQCLGRSYIEDESVYGTFHIGFGRNLALGGNHNAKGHFDVVFKKPNIWADGALIMKDGEAVDQNGQPVTY